MVENLATVAVVAPGGETVDTESYRNIQRSAALQELTPADLTDYRLECMNCRMRSRHPDQEL